MMRVPLNQWYAVLEPREVRRRPVTVERFGVRLVFWRSTDGVPHAQRDRCPHLGASLGGGTVHADTLATENQMDVAHLPFVHHNNPPPSSTEASS